MFFVASGLSGKGYRLEAEWRFHDLYIHAEQRRMARSSPELLRCLGKFDRGSNEHFRLLEFMCIGELYRSLLYQASFACDDAVCAWGDEPFEKDCSHLRHAPKRERDGP